MNISPHKQLVIDTTFEYFNEQGFQNVVIYGSYVERIHGLTVYPNDIDVCVILDEEPPTERHTTLYLGHTGLPINVEFMTRSMFNAELRSLQPKYFMCIANPAIQKEIDFAFSAKELHEVRACISDITSKAFYKGKKKLSVPDDYDKVLGLKNLFHAFKFPLYAKWFYTDADDTDKQIDILTLNSIHEQIEAVYDMSTGTLEERCNALIAVFKPLHNSMMSQFRIDFPKKV